MNDIHWIGEGWAQATFSLPLFRVGGRCMSVYRHRIYFCNLVLLLVRRFDDNGLALRQSRVTVLAAYRITFFSKS
jgi:hypothetical protein